MAEYRTEKRYGKKMTKIERAEINVESDREREKGRRKT